jgi:hypothetical protein
LARCDILAWSVTSRLASGSRKAVFAHSPPLPNVEFLGLQANAHCSKLFSRPLTPKLSSRQPHRLAPARDERTYSVKNSPARGTWKDGKLCRIVHPTTLSHFAPGNFTLGGVCSWQATPVSPNSTKFFRVPSIGSGEHLHRCLIHG